MKEVNKPEEKPVIEEVPVIKEKLEELKQEEKPLVDKAPTHRPYIGHKKEQLIALLEKWRELSNEVVTLEDKEYSRKRITELEKELKKRP